MISRENLLNLEKRRLLYNLILNNPGLHLREIFRNFDLSEGAIKYHLKYLKARRLIIEKNEDGYKRFYVRNKVCEKYKKMWNIFRKDTPKEIVLYLLVYMASSRIKLSRVLDKNPKVIEYHIKNLLKNNILEVAKVKNGLVYLNNDNPKYKEYKSAPNEVVYILRDQQMIEDFILTYEKSFLKDPIPVMCISWINSLKGSDFSEKTKVKRKLRRNSEKSPLRFLFGFLHLNK